MYRQPKNKYAPTCAPLLDGCRYCCQCSATAAGRSVPAGICIVFVSAARACADAGSARHPLQIQFAELLWPPPDH
ncbi:hypothetical protein EVAR_83292_1 [Eumeta japonica]|uniref:Uncharacterized protein n=1 Tax=Eumeta variegata TaxID=151549 RepID=A0A4C1X8R5_EUMVA|nr:hypothetical protein EVAR_83292_1 [Eumeta japonica]